MVLVAIGSFVEIVALPEFRPRSTPATAGVTNVVAAQDDTAGQTTTAVVNDEQTVGERQQQRDRLEKQVRSTHQQLGNACAALREEVEATKAYSKDKLNFDPGSNLTPTQLAEVLVKEPTARVALSNVIDIYRRAERLAGEEHELLDRVGTRFGEGSFLLDDDHDMKAGIDQLENMRESLRPAQSCIDHITILKRARAALAHAASLDSTTGDPQ